MIIKRSDEVVPQPSGKAIDCNSVIAGSNLAGTSIQWGCGGMVDARDLKSLGSNTVRVQLPPSPPLNSVNKKCAPIAQLDRAFDYGSKGCGFKSCWARQKLKILFFLGMQLSLVEYLIWDQGVAGSNPVIPTIKFIYLARQLSWLEQSVHTRQVVGSSPTLATNQLVGPLAQLVRASGS